MSTSDLNSGFAARFFGVGDHQLVAAPAKPKALDVVCQITFVAGRPSLRR